MADVIVHPECPFSEETFNLLAQLKTNSKDLYIAHEKEFKQYVENPIQQLSRKVAAQLPGEIIKRLELKFDASTNFSHKSYEGNFFKKTQPFSITNASLFIDITSVEFRFGLFILDKTDDKKRFIRNSQRSFNKEIILQNTCLPDDCKLHFSSSGKSLDHINRLGDTKNIAAILKTTKFSLGHYLSLVAVVCVQNEYHQQCDKPIMLYKVL